MTSPLPTGNRLWHACWLGREPAEALPVSERLELFLALLRSGWPVTKIASHTRSTPYAVLRVLERARGSDMVATLCG